VLNVNYWIVGLTMQHTMVWFGYMTHGSFTISNDTNPMVIINSIEEKSIMDPNDVDNYLESQGYDSYLIPDEFEGEVVFSKSFFKGLIA
jgi:hypothetical protein